MRHLAFFLVLVLISSSLTVFGQRYTTPSGKPIQDLKSYLLEGGIVIEQPNVPEAPEYDIGIGGYIHEFKSPLDDQRALGSSNYRPPEINLPGSSLLRENLGNAIANFGKVKYNNDQLREQQEQADVARRVDAIRQALPLMLQNIESLTREIESGYAESRFARASSIQKRNREIEKSDFAPEKKRALINMNRVKLNNDQYEGEFGTLFNAVRSKYSSIPEEDIKHDVSYPFLDMGATAFHQAASLQKEGNSEGALDSLELSNTFLDIGLGAVPFVGAFKDSWEAYTGKNLVTGDTLSSTERMMAVAAVGIGLLSGGTLGGAAKLVLNAERLAAISKYSSRILPFAKESVASSKALMEAGFKAGANTVQGVKDFIRASNALAKLPKGMSIIRFRPGNNPGKVAAIGRKMSLYDDHELVGGVNKLKEHLADNKFTLETFNPTTNARNELNKMKDDLGRYLTYEEVKTTRMYLENKEWSQRILGEGYTILDIGDSSLANFKEGVSAFYDLEISLFFGIKKI